MIHVDEVIVVEGKYDKNTLSQLVDATIVETDGFGVFSNDEKLALLRRLADERGLVVLTDSDGAGFVIRNFLKSAIDPSKVKHAYIPDIHGKEKRKARPGREGKLGVEGMRPEVLLEALRRAGVTVSETDAPGEPERLTKADLYSLGLSGQPDSAARRAALLKKLSLPEKLSPNALLDVLNALYSRETFLSLFPDAVSASVPRGDCRAEASREALDIVKKT
ncbi:MAG: toprim domain-containing protein [Oscillospiraceae bacterium]|jgi:ribonuclease M5